MVRAAEISPADFQKLIFNQRTGELTTNSLLLVLTVTATAVTVGGFQAFLIQRTQVRFKVPLTFVAVLPLAIPSYIAAMAWMSSFTGVRGFLPAWAVLSFGTAPYVFLAVSAAFAISNPRVEEVARSLGRSSAQVFREVTWPAIRTAVAASALVVALYTLSDFGAVSLLQYDTFTRAIFNSYRSSFDRTAAAALALMVVLITSVLVIIQRRWFGTTSANQRIARPLLIRSPRFQTIGALAVFVWAIPSLFIPIGAVVRWSIIGQSDADFGEIFRALINTAGYGISGGLLIAVIAIAIAVIRYRSVNRLGRIFETTTWLSHALPGIVIALSLVFFSNRLLPGVYQTSLIVLIAYIALFLPNAVTALAAPIQQLPKSLEEVSRSLGTGRFGTFYKVLLPNLRVPLLSAYALITLTIFKELPATLLLRPSGIETLSTRLWSASSINAFSAAAPYALLMIVLAGIPTLMLNREISNNLRNLNQSSPEQKS